MVVCGLVLLVVIAQLLGSNSNVLGGRNSANLEKSRAFNKPLGTAWAQVLDSNVTVLEALGFDGECLYAESPAATYKIAELAGVATSGKSSYEVHMNTSLAHTSGWNFQRVDGGPDLRRKNNYQVCRSSVIGLTVQSKATEAVVTKHHRVFGRTDSYMMDFVLTDLCKKIQGFLDFNLDDRNKIIALVNESISDVDEISHLAKTIADFEQKLAPLQRGLNATSSHFSASDTDKSDRNILEQTINALSGQLIQAKQRHVELMRRQKGLIDLAKVKLAVGAAKAIELPVTSTSC